MSSAVEVLFLNRAPALLAIHLKRFQQDMRGRLRKIDGAVTFDFDLDITPFCDPKVSIKT